MANVARYQHVSITQTRTNLHDYLHEDRQERVLDVHRAAVVAARHRRHLSRRTRSNDVRPTTIATQRRMRRKWMDRKRYHAGHAAVRGGAVVERERHLILALRVCETILISSNNRTLHLDRQTNKHTSRKRRTASSGSVTVCRPRVCGAAFCTVMSPIWIVIGQMPDVGTPSVYLRAQSEMRVISKSISNRTRISDCDVLERAGREHLAVDLEQERARDRELAVARR
jgi:hypothetical protein